MFPRFAIVLLVASAAYAGVNGTTILNYSIENQTGATANVLNVQTDADGPTVVAFSPFTSDTVSSAQVDFSGGSGVPSLDAATFTLEGTIDNFFDNPAVQGYCWASGCDPTSTPRDTPIQFVFAPGGTTLGIFTDSTTDSFSGLYATQDGNPLYTDSTTGSVGTSFMTVASDIDFSKGAVDFGLTDTSDGVTINGSFTASTPEPAPTGLCVLMLAGMVVAVRHRQLRRQ